MIEWTDKIASWDYGRKLTVKRRTYKGDLRINAVIQVLSDARIITDDPLEQIAEDILRALKKAKSKQPKRKVVA